MSIRQLRDYGLGIAALIVALVLWQVWATARESFFFPPITTVLAAFVEDWFSPLFMEHAVPSLIRMLLGYLLGALLGVLLGILTGSFQGLFETLDPFFEFFRAIPPPIIIPIAILIMGIGDAMQILVIAFGVFWPVLLNSADGARNTSSERLDTAINFGLGRLAIVRRVIFPSALPMVFAGLRVGLSLALIMIVISEMIGSTNGIGYYTLDAQRTFAVPQMFGGILLLAILGFVLNNLFLALEGRVLAWHRGQSGELSA